MVGTMTTQGRISHHLDLYHYWLVKRGGRAMPARRDIDPADIPALLPYLSLVHNVCGEFRFRLFGSAIGRDMTGAVLGSGVSSAPEPIAAAQAMSERVFTSARPVFATAQYETKWGTIHNSSGLFLPLSDNGTHVDISIVTRVTCFPSDAIASRDWLEGAPLKIGEVVNIDDAADLERHCLDWQCGATPL
jgi:hypothetical protein